MIRFFDMFSGIKQAGNAVTVNVVYELGLRLKAVHAASVAATCTNKEEEDR